MPAMGRLLVQGILTLPTSGYGFPLYLLKNYMNRSSHMEVPLKRGKNLPTHNSALGICMTRTSLHLNSNINIDDWKIIYKVQWEEYRPIH